MKILLFICLLSTTIFAKSTFELKEFYPTGKLKSKIPYAKDTIDGIREEYYKSGKLIAEVPYKNNILNGVFKAYYPTGKLQLEIPFKNGTIDGIYKEYYRTGKLKQEMPFKDGKKNGLGKTYNPTGKMQTTLLLDEDFDTIIKVYSQTDTLLIELTIEHGKVAKDLSVPSSANSLPSN